MRRVGGGFKEPHRIFCAGEKGIPITDFKSHSHSGAG